MYYKEVYKDFLEIVPHDSCTIVSLFFSTFIFFCLHYTHLTPGSLLLDSQFLLLGTLGSPAVHSHNYAETYFYFEALAV